MRGAVSLHAHVIDHHRRCLICHHAWVDLKMNGQEIKEHRSISLVLAGHLPNLPPSFLRGGEKRVLQKHLVHRVAHSKCLAAGDDKDRITLSPCPVTGEFPSIFEIDIF